ncbi:hypothetical protein [Nitrospira moscoviensis]|jgi:hypothetical protein|uniref:Uncharacterized protein n=1 Tax=Nitrospira moscoviensis TaxID=42253 RepID=A0A0K2GID0_NITMO|nr:hypothetical protein [Nitrospira moscoviensis]ALA60372.1 conserved exported protein of unknown function [Nitrospira moscoviensis]
MAQGVWLLTGALILLPGAAQSIEFVADQLTNIDGRVHRASLYCRDDMWRVEHNDQRSVEVTIVRKDKGVMWLLLARVKQFATVLLDPASKPSCQQELGRITARVRIGTEVLDGHPTTVSLVTARKGDQDVVYYEWWAEDIHLPLRLARKDGSWIIEYKNVKLRQVSPLMFELPLHYRPIN